MPQVRSTFLLAALGFALSAAVVALNLSATANQPIMEGYAEDGTSEERQDLASGLDDCFREVADASILVQTGIRGCFGGSDNSVLLQRQAEEWTLTMREFVGPFKHRAMADEPVPIADVRQLLTTLGHSLTNAPPKPEGYCTSTSTTFARVSGVCDQRKLPTLYLETSECGGLGREAEDGIEPNSFAMQVFRWSQNYHLRNRARAPIREFTAEEELRWERNLAALYEAGPRVTHGPFGD